MIIILINCVFCGKDFDIDSTSFIRFSNSCYLHEECVDKYLDSLSKNEKDKYSLELYINRLFKIKSIPQAITRTIADLTNNYGFTYSGILKTLIYWYEIKKKSIKDSKGSIGIVPYIYNDAKEYYKKLDTIKRLNEDKKIEEYLEAEKETIHIKPPVSKVKKKRSFVFLDEEET